MSAGVWMRASAWSARGQARGARQDRTRFREAEGAAGGAGGGWGAQDSAHGSPTCSGANGRKRCACVSKHTRTVEGNHVSLISAVAPGMKGVSCGTSVFATLLEVFQDCIHVREDIYSI